MCKNLNSSAWHGLVLIKGNIRTMCLDKRVISKPLNMGADFRNNAGDMSLNNHDIKDS